MHALLLLILCTGFIIEAIGYTEFFVVHDPGRSGHADAVQGSALVDKLIGDSLMVVWGNPVYQERHAEKAVEAALEMQAVMKHLRRKWKAKLGVDIDLGIGINTDEVVVGTIGSEEFCDYTVLGSGVNIAARIERTSSGGEICISRKTADLLSDHYRCERMGRFDYKNVKNKIEVFKVNH